MFRETCSAKQWLVKSKKVITVSSFEKKTFLIADRNEILVMDSRYLVRKSSGDRRTVKKP
jgi:hypothetical protein